MTDKYEHLAAAPTRTTTPSLWGTPEPGTFCVNSYKSLLYDDVLIHRWELDDRDRLVGFALVHMTKHHGEDHTVVEVDTRHGHVHLHQYRPGNNRIGEPRTIRMLHSQQDVEAGYDDALDEITQKWEDHRRRWQRGR